MVLGRGSFSWIDNKRIQMMIFSLTELRLFVFHVCRIRSMDIVRIKVNWRHLQCGLCYTLHAHLRALAVTNKLSQWLCYIIYRCTEVYHLQR